MLAGAFETDNPPSVEKIAFTVLLITRFIPETWDGWHHSLGNNDAQLQKFRELARIRPGPISAFISEPEPSI